MHSWTPQLAVDELNNEQQVDGISYWKFFVISPNWHWICAFFDNYYFGVLELTKAGLVGGHLFMTAARGEQNMFEPSFRGMDDFQLNVGVGN